MPHTILIVDDNDDLRQLLSFHLGLLGYHVIEAGDGQEAIKIYRQTIPHLILMDINMPVLDGISATRVIREYNQTVPIIICSCVAKEYREEAIAAGCTDFIEKPVDTLQLQSTIQKFLTVS